MIRAFEMRNLLTKLFGPKGQDIAIKVPSREYNAAMELQGIEIVRIEDKVNGYVVPGYKTVRRYVNHKVGEKDEAEQEIKKPEIWVKPRQVVRRENGQKYMAYSKHVLPDGATIVCDKPHQDNDYSYLCDNMRCPCGRLES